MQDSTLTDQLRAAHETTTAKTNNEVRKLRQGKAGRQGDLIIAAGDFSYVVDTFGRPPARITFDEIANLDAVVKIGDTDHQLVAGASVGSRHVAKAGAWKLFEVQKNHFRRDFIVAVGIAEAPMLFTHPVHGDYEVPAGKFIVTRQCELAENNELRVNRD